MNRHHEWLARALADKKYQQRDLAKAWEVDDAVVTRFLATGKPDLTPERQIKLIQMLGISHDELMKRMFGGAKAQPKRPEMLGVTNSGSLEGAIREVRSGIERLKRMLPGARIVFRIDYSDGDVP